MHVRTMVLFCALAFVNLVNAAEYYWVASNGNTSFSGPSPSSACSQYAEFLSDVTFTYKFTSFEFYSPSLAHCKLERVRISTGTKTDYFVDAQRSGDSCRPDSVYNSTTGACDVPLASDGEWCSPPDSGGAKVFIMSNGVCVAPAEAALKDQCKAFAKDPLTSDSVVTVWRYPTNDNADLRNPQKVVNKLGCEVQLLEEISCRTSPATIFCNNPNDKSDCTSFEKTLKCRVKGVLNGKVAPDPLGTPAGSKCTGDECVIEPPVETKESKPCTYVYDAEGRKSCSTWNYKGKEGAEQCGTIGGVFSCKDDLPKAVGKGLSIGTVIDEETQADGSKKTTKTDTAKNVTCIGNNACTTTVTTNKTVSIHGADGSLKSNSSSCTGPQCPSSGSPDVDGDGFGDCEGTDCGKEEKGGAAGTSGDCGVPPACDGDPFQCSILKQSWQNTCKTLEAPTTEQQKTMDDKVAQSEGKIVELQQELDQKVSALIGDFKAGSTPGSVGSGVCFPDYPIQFLDRQITLPFSQVCPFLALLAKALMVVAYLVAARIVSREF